MEYVEFFDRWIKYVDTLIRTYPYFTVRCLVQYSYIIAAHGRRGRRIILKYFERIAIESIQPIFGAKPHKSFSVLEAT